MRRALDAELFKLRTTRTSWGVIGGALALVLIISVVAALAGDFSPTDRPGHDLIQIAGLAQLFALVLGILVVATEFRHGTITPTLLAVPDRVRLVLAKLIAGLVAGVLLGFFAWALCTSSVLILLSTRGVIAETDAKDLLNLAIGNVVASGLYCAIGVGLGAIIRNQVGAIIGALVWLFVIEPLLGIIPGFADVISKWFPSGAASEASGIASGDDLLGQLPGSLLLAAYATVFVVLGLAIMRRRDVSA